MVLAEGGNSSAIDALLQLGEVEALTNKILEIEKASDSDIMAKAQAEYDERQRLLGIRAEIESSKLTESEKAAAISLMPSDIDEPLKTAEQWSADKIAELTAQKEMAESDYVAIVESDTKLKEVNDKLESKTIDVVTR